jgi:hypothetical protein
MAKASKAEIRREAYAVGKTDVARAVIAALALFQSGYGVDEKCPKSGSVIEVKGLYGCRDVYSVWIIKSPCGACNDTWHGL